MTGQSLSTKTRRTLLATMFAITLLFLGIGIPLQLDMSQNSADLIGFSLDAIALRDNDNLANELLERRYAAIRLRVQEILQVEKVRSVAIYDRQGGLIEAVSSAQAPPANLEASLRAADERQVTESFRVLRFLKPIRAVGETFGWIRIEYDMLETRRQAVIFYAFFGGLLLLSLGCIFIIPRWRMRQYVIAPLGTLVQAMENARSTDLLLPVDSPGQASEVASLIKTYNDMSRRLRASYSELDCKNAELEKALGEKESKAAALEASERRLRAIVEQAPVGIILFDNKGTVISANKYFAMVMGSPSPEHIVGIDMLRDIDAAGVVACVRQAIEEGQSIYEDYYTSLTGRKVVYIRARLLRVSANELCGVFEDLSEQKSMLKALSDSESQLASLNRDLEETVARRTLALTQQATELQQANERLKELDELKTFFLSSVSHELRTPLTSILGFATLTLKSFRRHITPLIGKDDKVVEKAREIEANLAIVRKEGERLSRLVNEVLDLARIESGQMPWNDVAINPAEVLEDVISSAAGDFQEPNLVLQTDIQADMAPILIDPDRLFQVVRNLLHNAVKFVQQGSITLSARQDPEMNAIEIRVADTGPGIREEDIESIFDRFHQLEASQGGTAKPQGSGLGLTICQQIVEHYQGRIRVESTPGEGATFIIHLPLQRREPDA